MPATELLAHKRLMDGAAIAIQDWLRLEFGLEKPGTALGKPHLLDADAFIAAVRKALPKRQRLSAAGIQRLKQEHADTVQPARDAATQALALNTSSPTSSTLPMRV